MANSIDPDFEVYCRALVTLGHDRDWVRRNSGSLRERYALDPTPFPAMAAHETRRDRYEEL